MPGIVIEEEFDLDLDVQVMDSKDDDPAKVGFVTMTCWVTCPMC
ncbi:FDLD family class I lanthipeptide [Streptomyces roseoverticillatus]|nr:FDLD family class I lanthipeptide [Streptomyces roseoverticillatus]MCF3106548.1 FDLD family class I lanthipeptide [Streptomyces roseoverticillatus]